MKAEEVPASNLAFEALQQFAKVWHDKYAHHGADGENRKPPSLTMRAGNAAAVLTEPRLAAAVEEYARTKYQLRSATYREALLAPYEAVVHDLQALLRVDEQGEQDPWKIVNAVRTLLELQRSDVGDAVRANYETAPRLCRCGCRILKPCTCSMAGCACAPDCIVCSETNADD